MPKNASDDAVADVLAGAAVAPTATLDVNLNRSINIANYMSYAQGNTPLPASLGLEPLMVNGQIVRVLNESKGVYAEAFITTTAGPNGKQIYIGYEGTDPYAYSNSFTGSQVNNDGALFAGKTAEGAEPSAAFARQVLATAKQLGIDKSNVFLTGANSGGSLAEYVGERTGLSGTTFGAPGIQINGVTRESKLTNYVNAGDPIGNYGFDNSNPLGPLLISPQITHYGGATLIGNTGPNGPQSNLTSAVHQGYASHNYTQVGLAVYFLGKAYAPLSSYASSLNANPNTQVDLIDLGGGATAPNPSSPLAIGGAVVTAIPGQDSFADGLSGAPPKISQPSSLVPPSPPPLTATQINQYVNLSNYMYYAKVLPYGQTNLKTELGLKPLLKSGQVVTVTKNGVTAEAFVTTGPGAKRVIVAYEGTAPYAVGSTNEFTGAQIYDDTSLFAGQTPIDAEVAARFAQRVLNIAGKRGIDSSNVTLTGHSLGAAEAQYAALQTGLAGATFGGPGIKLTGSQAPGKLVNFINEGDPVGNYGIDGEHPYTSNNAADPGTFVTTTQINHYGTDNGLGASNGATVIGDSDAEAAQEAIQTATNNFYDPSNSAYRDVGTALFAIGSQYMYHHLSYYVNSLNATYFTGTSAVELFALCYCTGTAIRTSSGDRPVETLQPGDFVVTAAGETRPVKWIGQRMVDCRRHPRPSEVWPVRIAANAFGEGRPGRDLFLSPGHPVLVGADADDKGGVLVPIMCLINGTTVCREPLQSVGYWHVELDEHEILVAEGLPAESYIDLGSRGWFAGADGALCDPDTVIAGETGRCRPVATDGPVVEAERRRLDMLFSMRLTTACGWPSEETLALQEDTFALQ